MHPNGQPPAIIEATAPRGFSSTSAQSQAFKEKDQAQALATQITETLIVVDRHEEVHVEYPPLPFSTALLLEDAATSLGWTVARITETAQQLFETGLITYPRTDSTHLAPAAIQAGRQVISILFGPDALGNEALIGEKIPPQTPEKRHWWQRYWQSTPAGDTPSVEEETPLEAHEAIRPTNPAQQPEMLRTVLTLDGFTLYTLIWTRFLASLMKPARYRVITLELETTP